MLQGRGGPVGGAVRDRRTAIAEQIEHRAGVRLRADKTFSLELAAQRVDLPARDFERVHGDGS